MCSRRRKFSRIPNNCSPSLREICLMKRSRLLACVSVLGALYLATHAALADDSTQRAVDDATATNDVISAIRTEVVIADKLAGEFEALAGSLKNAQNLVVGLRNAKPVKMTAPAPAQLEVSFTPPTQPMSFSDIHTALSLAQAQLRSKHIDNPTPAHLKAALAGGELPNANGDMTRVIGILPLHRRGMDWEQIARVLRVAAPKRMAVIQAATRNI